MKQLFASPTVACLLVLFASLTCGMATAQEGAPWALQRTLQPDFEGRDLLTMNTMLQLDAGQQEALNEAFRRYEASFQDNARTLREMLPPGWANAANRPDRESLETFRTRMQELVEEMRKAQDALPEGADPAPIHERFREQVQQLREQLNSDRPRLDEEQRLVLAEQAAAALDRWSALNLELKQNFVGEVQALLRDEQQSLWLPLERRLTREKTLSRGRLSGESLDLVSMMDQLELEEDVLESLRPLIDEYYRDLHEALITRNDYLERTRRDLQRAMAKGEQSQIEAVESRRIQMHVLVRDVNDQYAELFADRLPVDAGHRFTELYGSLAYPQIYRPTRAQRMFKAARSLIGLNEVQLIAIEDLQDAYLMQLERANRELLDVFRESEPGRIALGTRTRSAQEDDRMRAALRARLEMGDREVDKLEAILSPDQLNQLPNYRAPRRSQ